MIDPSTYIPEFIDLVDDVLIAERLGVRLKTVRQWRWRGVLPAEDFPQLKHPVWLWDTIEDWATKTGRNQT